MKYEILDILEKKLKFKAQDYEEPDVIFDLYEDRERVVNNVAAERAIIEEYDREIDEMASEEAKGYFREYESIADDRRSECYKYLYKFGICDGVKIITKGTTTLDCNNILKKREINRETIDEIIDNRTMNVIEKAMDIVNIKKYDNKLIEIEKKIKEIYEETSILEKYEKLKNMLNKKELSFWKVFYQFGIYEILQIFNTGEKE